MKFLLFVLGMAAVMLALFFVGLFSGNTALLALGFCPFVSFGNPLIWIAMYKLLTQDYELVRRNKSIKPGIQRRVAGDIADSVGVR